MNQFFFISPLILQKAIWNATRAVLFLFCRFEVRGLENLHVSNKIRPYIIAKRGMIFAANHSSELDAIVVPASLPFFSPLLPIFYVSRPREFYKTSGWRQLLYGGFFFKMWGAHAAISGSRDYEQSLAAHIKILEKGGSVLIFPEGRKTRNGNMGTEVHGGVAYLAHCTGCPVVPVHISGNFNMTFGDFFLRRRHIVVVFGTPILLSENNQKEYKKEAGIILSEIASLRQKN
ncbi:MAG: lysophospholipid acyltransferase family protein [bacterium]|nr:lysophospholipid acyltransferase family protein [bacterium]